MKSAQERKLLKKFGNHLAQLRKKRNLTQQELAERVNMSVVSIAYLETGKRWTRIDTLRKLARALKTSISELFKDL